MKSIEYFWGMGYISVILFAIIQNGAFQNDFIDFFSIPFMWYVRFCEWLIYPTYDNGFNQKIAYTGGEAWVIRFLAIVAVLFILVIVMVIIMETIKQYKKMWDEISQMFLIGSLSGIAVLGDVIRGYLTCEFDPVICVCQYGNQEIPKRSKSLLKKKMALHFICLAHLLNTIFSCITSIFISFLHFGQYSGNFTRTVSSYTFVLVFSPQIGQWIQREFFRLAFTLYTSIMA